MRCSSHRRPSRRTTWDVWVPRTRPPRSGDHPVLVDDVAEAIGPSQSGEVDLAEERRRRVERRRRTLVERPVRAVGVVVLEVLGKDCLEGRRPRMSIRSRHSRRLVPMTRSQMALARGARRGLCGEHGIERSNELLVAVADQELDPTRLFGELHGDVAGLLGHPISNGRRGDAGDPDTTRVQVGPDLRGDGSMPAGARERSGTGPLRQLLVDDPTRFRLAPWGPVRGPYTPDARSLPVSNRSLSLLTLAGISLRAWGRTTRGTRSWPIPCPTKSSAMVTRDRG